MFLVQAEGDSLEYDAGSQWAIAANNVCATYAFLCWANVNVADSQPATSLALSSVNCLWHAGYVWWQKVEMPHQRHWKKQCGLSSAPLFSFVGGTFEFRRRRIQQGDNSRQTVQRLEFLSMAFAFAMIAKWQNTFCLYLQLIIGQCSFMYHCSIKYYP